jgi:methylenetetrahydrofolate reductase (NADPH)
MKVTQHIEAITEKPYSPEIIPPQKESIQELYDNIPLMEFKPPFIDVTTSRENLFM